MKTYELTINRTLPASPDEVYDAWLDPTLSTNPWHGSLKLEWEPKQGNLWYFLHQSKKDEPRNRPHFGRFAKLERGKRIELDWMSYNTCGMESKVTVTLKAKGDETLLTLNHANIPDNELGRAHEQGWAHFTGLLEQKFAKAKA
jgi:uncharacterized protein YndB with AHSA1/START domain